ncbi:DUF2807 domain-containing protein [Flavobacterium amnicola]|uniref:DUF2807 domain-containing protein n=1 Tax=Flavobacterium amnicola TaxID=2506422 RepID=A0A4Q1K501_9FLAO|nr:head GIN domain-containing protein [Flavobacterium amnicola]RXR20963.1 DUF2807 domain-containing protein [Flavobacterium amnicola]
MKKLIFLFFIFNQMVNAQINKALGDFTKVTSFDQISVFLIASNENKIEISGFNANKVELVYENNELKIRMPLDKLLQGNDILAKVYYTKLEAVEANEGSNIGASTPIVASNFDIIVKEASSIKLNVETKKITARVTQGGRLEVIGKTNNLDVVVNAAAVFNSQNCETSVANVSVNTGGQATVKASELVDAQVRAGGTINIYGKPKQVNQKTILGGEIVLRN